MATARLLYNQVHEEDHDPYLLVFETLWKKETGWKIDENVPSKIMVKGKQLVMINALSATVRSYHHECRLPCDQLNVTESC